MKNILLLIFLWVFACPNLNAQTNAMRATTYFENYLIGQKMVELCAVSLPSEAECKLVFKDSNATHYYGFIKYMADNLNGITKKDTNVFIAVRVDTFTTEDVLVHKGNYAGGMNGIADRLIEGAVFYKINFMRKTDDEYGYAYNYWIKIGERWVFFPKPWYAFKDLYVR
jgi:hypothetical protein